MATNPTIIDIVDGPGEFAFASSLLRGEAGRVTIGRKIYQIKVDSVKAIDEKRESFEIGGELELSPGKWVAFEGARYSVRTRKGHLVFQMAEMEQHPVCLHLVPKGVRRCPHCGADRMDVS